ncbi:Crp/Fnr family transcriptional regulator [Aquimarina sp. D1M17]|uniref:Crp/Fnr family transcriptional regulator n=1 Tax=Aquimarina acroporae TaxID=2937283 RepID=UPI0020C181C3|nr:Crp/Fnr family transcriptional regulator [Aquimarina acroporae]MCK8523486.1 Crp/Fnr family transcriptional regulator [Aquimarina acroporae]
MNPNLTEYIKRYVTFSEKENNLFQSYLKPIKLKKKEFLLKAGQFCKSRFFITKGCVRLFYIDNKGNEQIIHFGIDNWWITDYESLITNKPTTLNIQAIEPTELLELPQEKFDELCDKVPQTERLFRKVMERTYIPILKRIEYIYSLKGEEQFRLFISENPEFTQRVPQYMIASYLGMSPEFVSKIRAKIK